MKKRFLIVSIMVLLAFSTFITIGAVNGQRGSFTLPWSVIGSGGMGGTAGSYTLHSTLGQPVAGALDGGSYHLTSGFWTEVIEAIEEFFSFLPLILR